jgi:aldehyde dehydrogenase (NAD+)
VKVPLRHADALFIAGTWTRPVDGRTESVINPATEEVLGEAALGGPVEVEMRSPPRDTRSTMGRGRGRG